MLWVHVNPGAIERNITEILTQPIYGRNSLSVNFLYFRILICTILTPRKTKLILNKWWIEWMSSLCNQKTCCYRKLISKLFNKKVYLESRCKSFLFSLVKGLERPPWGRKTDCSLVASSWKQQVKQSSTTWTTLKVYLILAPIFITERISRWVNYLKKCNISS